MPKGELDFTPPNAAGYVAKTDYTAGDIDAKIRSLTPAQRAGLVGARPLDTGLVGYWNMDGVPDWPDGTATMFFDTITSGLAGTYTTLSYGGVVRATATGSGTGYFRCNGVAGWTSYTAKKTLRLRMRGSKSGNVTIREYSGGYYDTVLALTTAWQLYDFESPATAGLTVTDIYVQLTGFITANDWVELDWIYIGDGTYSSPLVDNSGNGNHGTVAGATPTEGVSGRALIFDGVNDSVVTSLSVPTVGSCAFWFKASAIDANDRLIADTGGYWIIEFNTATSIRFRINDGGSKATSEATVATGSWYHCVAVWTGAAIRMYINAAQVGADVSAASPASLSAIRLANVGALYFSGTLDEPRIYNRALSADEVMGLYLQKGGADAHKRAVSAVPNSLVMRAASGGISFRGAVADADAETLDDYEEGTWTPGISFGGGTTGITYTNNSGSYTKIGNRVFFNAYVLLSSKGSSTGAALVTGLPFTVTSGAAGSVASIIVMGITFADYPEARLVLSGTTIDLLECTNAGVQTTLTDADFTNTSTVRVTGHYNI